MSQGSKVVRAVNLLTTLAFILSVAVQYNDPDPIPWAAIYGSAAACGFLYHRRVLHWIAPAAVASISIVWAGFLAPRVIGHVSFIEMFQSVGMKSIEIEEGREMFGLAIVAVWMIVLGIASRRPSAAGYRAS